MPVVALHPMKSKPVLYQTLVLRLNGVPAEKFWFGIAPDESVEPDALLLPKVTAYVFAFHFA